MESNIGYQWYVRMITFITNHVIDARILLSGRLGRNPCENIPQELVDMLPEKNR